MLHNPAVRGLSASTLAAGIAALWLAGNALGQNPAAQPAPAAELPDRHPLMEIGPGDTVTISVYDQPDMTATVYVSDDGTMPVALVGAVQVAGLSPAGAAKAVEKALQDGKFFKKPQVTITIAQARSQRVSVLGEVVSPNRYQIDSRTSVLDLLAQAGGVRDTAGTTAYLVRAGTNGQLVRYPVDLHAIGDNLASVPGHSLQGGDQLLVPKAEKFFIHGEVTASGEYPIEPNMTIEKAIVRAGGIGVRGSRNRVEVKRTGPDGKVVTLKGKPEDLIQPGDVIRVKESIF